MKELKFSNNEKFTTFYFVALVGRGISKDYKKELCFFSFIYGSELK